jgi:hypothetical protein
MSSKQDSFDYAKFDDSYVSKAALLQGCRITTQEWDHIKKMVNEGLKKNHFTPSDNFRSKRAKQIKQELTREIVTAFPDFTKYIPPDSLPKGICHIIQRFHRGRRRKRAGTSKLKPSAAKSSAIVANTAAPTPISMPPDTESNLVDLQFQPTASHPSAAERVPDANLTMTAVPADKSSSSNLSKEKKPERLVSEERGVNVEHTDRHNAQNSGHRQIESSTTPSTAKRPDLPTPDVVAEIKVDDNLKKIQLCATVLGDKTDTSFVNLGELLLKNKRRPKAVSYTSVEDITDEDWEFYHGTYLPSDLDRSFKVGIDKVYFDNGGEMVRVKNATSWRAAMVAMQKAGATQFRFYIEQPEICKSFMI